jgi:hypothetical protein
MNVREVRKAKHCQRCDRDITALLVRKISGSGVSMVFWQCPDCQDAIDKQPHWIKHDQLTASHIDPETLPIAGDYRQHEACAVCGAQARSTTTSPQSICLARRPTSGRPPTCASSTTSSGTTWLHRK